MTRRRRLVSPAVVGGTSLLVVFTAVVLAGTLQAARNTVAGVPYPKPEPAPTVQNRDAAPPAPAPEAVPPRTPAAPAPSDAASPPAPQAPRPRAATPPPANDQKPGTVRLARGGTATLVRREVGIDGVLPIPSAISQATWWGAELNVATGATVLAGHVNWRGATGPFAELWQAKVGDPVSVADRSGRRFAYRVSQIVTLHKDELPQRAEELFAQHGPHRLVLVTCGGRWVGGDIGYASNQIVIATPA